MNTTESASPNRGRPRQFDERTAISKALRVFRETGYDAASTDRLATEMGMKKQSVYRTFGNKSQLFDRCFADYLSKITIALEASFEGRNSFREATEACLFDAARFFHQSQSENLGCLVIMIAPVSPEKALLSQRAFSGLELKLQKCLTPFLESDGNAARDLSILIISFIQSLAIKARTGASLEELLRACEIFNRNISQINDEAAS